MIFMANSVRDLAPGATAKATFTYISPAEAGPAGGREPIATSPEADARNAGEPSRYPWPGAYRYNDGKVHAVNIVALRPAKARLAVAAAVRGLDLPDPRRETIGVELWPVLLAAAVLFWLGGWWARLH